MLNELCMQNPPSTLPSVLQSPCVRNCCLDNNDMCLGCFRQLDEILIWGQATDKQKLDILLQCDVRKKKQTSRN